MSSNLLSDSDSAPNTASLNRRKILITGCSTGIGYHCAKQLHADGHIVVAACRDESEVKQLIAEGLHSVQIDLADSESIAAGIRDTMTITNDELDVLINNGGYGQAGAVEDLSRELLEQQFAVNVFGTHELTVKLLKTLMKSDNPRIVQMGSVCSYSPWFFRGAYVASKFALRGLSETLRMELKDTRVKLSVIETGPIYSDYRKNEYENFLATIAIEKSRHIDRYKCIKKGFDVNRYPVCARPPQAVYKKIRQIIYAKNPKYSYRITLLDYAFLLCYRFLPKSFFTSLLTTFSDKKHRGFD